MTQIIDYVDLATCSDLLFSIAPAYHIMFVTCLPLQRNPESMGARDNYTHRIWYTYTVKLYQQIVVVTVVVVVVVLQSNVIIL